MLQQHQDRVAGCSRRNEQGKDRAAICKRIPRGKEPSACPSSNCALTNKANATGDEDVEAGQVGCHV